MPHERDPVLGKAPPDPRDYSPFDWETFVRLRAWAIRVAKRYRASVYLVGSALRTNVPRDVDIAVVWPADKFAALFGPIPPNGGTSEMRWYMHAIKQGEQWGQLEMDAQLAVNYQVRVDVHFCPDTWWIDQDRMLLGSGADVQGP